MFFTKHTNTSNNHPIDTLSKQTHNNNGIATAYIGLGSNLSVADYAPSDVINQAYYAIVQQLDSHARCSSLYSSSPMGPQDQPDYVNAVVSISTALAPLALLDALQDMEQQFGRVRLRHWGERTLDLDLLAMYDSAGNPINYVDSRLTLPHVGVLERDFVVIPLLELQPDLIVNQQPLRSLSLAHSHNLHTITLD